MQTSTTTVFHTVSPVHGLKELVYYRVNIEGTRTILSACQAARVKSFIFTSSSSVVWSDKDVGGLTEDEATIPEKIYEAYNHTKGVAEKMVGYLLIVVNPQIHLLQALRANGVSGMRVTALRPCGMVGYV